MTSVPPPPPADPPPPSEPPPGPSGPPPSPRHRRPRTAYRWLPPVVLLVVWLAVGAGLGPFTGRLSDVAQNDPAAFLPRDAESTRVLDREKPFQRTQTLPAVVVWTADGGARVTARQRTAATAAVASLTGARGVVGRPTPALPSRDGRALQAAVQLRPGLGDRLTPAVDGVRHAAERVPGTRVQVAGPAANQVDLSDAFSGIDGVLLVAALGTVLLILLLVYRSVLLPVVVILGAVFALGLASAIVYVLADHDVLRVDGQVQGILSILVIGAATDYALLITARFREELAARGDRTAAVVAALRQSFGAVAASAATVALALLALLISDLTNTRALGPVGAIGIACALLSACTFLPAVLALLGRFALWPARPRPADTATGGHGVWRRVAGLVDRAPRTIWISTVVVLGGFAGLSTTLSAHGVPLEEIFVNEEPSITAQHTLARHFPAGAGNPAEIVARADRARQVVTAAENTPGVVSAATLTATGRPGPPRVVDGRVRIDATLAAAADSDAAKAAVARLRQRVHAVPRADALVGGYTAQQADTEAAAERDRDVIVPVVLVIILCILLLLLRALLIPLLLVATVALNFAATLGVSALVFQHAFGFEGTDASVPLYGFVFLVALGVDYNIFLMSRVRQEALRHGPRQGVLRGLLATGGVITSAGVVLAATFASLVVIPLAFLVQVAFIVAFGVLLDTVVVRSLLAPALVLDIGPRAWWPSVLSRRPRAG